MNTLTQIILQHTLRFIAQGAKRQKQQPVSHLVITPKDLETPGTKIPEDQGREFEKELFTNCHSFVRSRDCVQHLITTGVIVMLKE